jgi:glucose-6-phosphate 1-dehydrogenase
MDEDDRPKASVHIRGDLAEASMEPVRARDPFTVVIFGASGDLSRRKLIPALYHLQRDGYLPDRFAVVGFSRTPMSDEAYRESMRAALEEHLREDGGGEVAADHPVVQALYYSPGDNDKAESFTKLKEKVEAIEKDLDLPGNRLFYLSVAPQFFPTVLAQLKSAGLIRPSGAGPWSRVIVEKPFGRDLASARELNQVVASALDESQIYRIDHYLGKETVQNILSFRFGNSIFEPLFNQKYIDHVQITVSETLGMEGRRGAYFDTAGTLRDMVQNHVLQLLCLIAMEPPSALDAQSVRDEKVKVLRALLPMSRKEVAANSVRGQYGVGETDGQIVKGYRQEEGVNQHSSTESFVALRVSIDNWRWAGVPFFLRSGKRLHRRVSEIAVQFKQPPLHLFRDLGVVEEEDGDGLRPLSNVLVMRIQPDEGISLSFACKRPGMRIQLAEVDMDFYYGRAFRQRSPEAYERLLLDALRGDASLFTRSDEVDYAWQFITSILEGWQHLPPPAFPNYYPFSDGPEEAARLIGAAGARWRPLAD